MPRTTISSTSPRTRTAIAASAVPAWIVRSVSPPPVESPATKPRPRDDDAVSRQRKILCRRCAAELSEAAAIFAMTTAGAAQTFVNPHGFLHDVVTVRFAENLFVAGAPTTEFTWFPGYAWQIAWCSGCDQHVGWEFTALEGGEPARFWGLRRDAIVESD